MKTHVCFYTDASVNTRTDEKKSWKLSFTIRLLLLSFSRQFSLVVFLRYLSVSKSPQVSRILCFWADLNNVVIWIVSVLSLISNFCTLFSILFGTVSHEQTTNATTVILTFLRFYLVPKQHLSICLLLFLLFYFQSFSQHVCMYVCVCVCVCVYFNSFQCWFESLYKIFFLIFEVIRSSFWYICIILRCCLLHS